MAVNLACAAPDAGGRGRRGGRRALSMRRRPRKPRSSACAGTVRDRGGAAAACLAAAGRRRPARLALAGDGRHRREPGEPAPRWRRCSRASWASAGASPRPSRAPVHAVYRDHAGRAGARDLAGARPGPRLERRRSARHARLALGAAGDRAHARLPAWGRASRAGPAPPGARRVAGRGRAGHRRLSVPRHVVGGLDPRRSPRPASSAASPTGSRSPRSSGIRSGCRSRTPR